MPKVCNVTDLSVADRRKLMRGELPGAYYVGRRHTAQYHDKHFGNPFTHLNDQPQLSKVRDRATAISAYEHWWHGCCHFNTEQARRTWVRDNISKLAGKDLYCWCAPKPCHADFLLEQANG